MRHVLLDTNIVLRYAYLHTNEHALIVTAIGRLLEAEDALYVTPQVLREFWAVATRPASSNGFGLTVSEAETSIGIVLQEFTLLDDQPGIFSDWLDLVTTHRVQGLLTHDANLAAAARFHGLTHVLTLNERDFKRYALSVLATLPPADF